MFIYLLSSNETNLYKISRVATHRNRGCDTWVADWFRILNSTDSSEIFKLYLENKYMPT
jgi:hypothetical protein